MYGVRKEYTYEGRKVIKNGIQRMIFVAISFLLETILIGLLFSRLAAYTELLHVLLRLLGFLFVLIIYTKNTTSAMRMPWIMLILLFPIFGTVIYVTIELNAGVSYMKKKFEAVDYIVMPYLRQDDRILERLKEDYVNAHGISLYILNYGGFPIYPAEHTTYFATAKEGLFAQIQDIRRAKRYIFMEYFTIENDMAWKQVEEILKQKVQEGIEVRVLYDDVGSIGYVNLNFAKELQKYGIKCIAFNPCTPGIKLILNHRDHRKMTIIDGEIAYTGGYNITNEYFEITKPFGRWKDTGIRVEGEAVKSFVVSFLSMWLSNNNKNDSIDENEELIPYFPSHQEDTLPGTISGFIQPYADTPLDHEHIGEEVYIALIEKSNSYCYFMTPYLIITDEMQHALTLAAKRGVDVRIITPGIPDKKLIYSVTRSFYHALVKNGVRIFEWTPGFCHAKMCLIDDQMGTCGSINLDYRSLYHHFENGCLMIGGSIIPDMKRDFDETFAQCMEVTEKYQTEKSFLRLGQLVLRLFAELL